MASLVMVEHGTLRRTGSPPVLRRLPALVCLALAPFAPAASQTGADAPRQLESAIHREFVLGDLKGAMEGYRAVLALEGAGREIVARALFQIGQCEEKLGNRPAAEEAYRRVSEEYGDQDPAAAARAKLAEWKEAVPGPRNLKFEEGATGKAPPGWNALALDKDKDFLAPLQRRGCRGDSCVLVQAPPNAPSPYGAMMQSFDATAYRGKTVRLRAWMRIEGTLPDDHGQMWLSVSHANRRSFFDNMDDRPVRSAQWTQCEITGEVARDAQFIEFGFMTFGKGRVWVDGVSFEVVK